MTTGPTESSTWLPVGEEPQPVGSITHLYVTRSEESSLLSLPTGDIDAEREPATGMYYHDTRYLSRLTFSFGGVPAVVLDAREVEHGLSAIFTNPTLRTPEGGIIAAQAVTVRRRRVLIDGMIESLAVSNYGRESIDIPLRIDFDADFCDIFEVRGFQRIGRPRQVTTERGERHVVFRYEGADGLVRATRIDFNMRPSELLEQTAVFDLHLEPRQTVLIEFTVATDRGLSESSFPAGVQRVRRNNREWFESITRIETDDESVNHVLYRALLDIGQLRGSIDGHQYIAAGVPWFDTLFGRDSLITGLQMLAFQPEILRWALLVLASAQAEEVDPARDAQPGKIPHEIRWGELANTGEVPFGRYYGSVDATPLFIVAALEYLRWTNDLATIKELWPNIERAMGWCLEAMNTGVRGFLSYQRLTAIGLENQGWKDSHDAITWPDGSLAKAPIALVEVQGYLAQALGAYVRLAAAVGQRLSAEDLARPSRFAIAFEEAFGHDELGYVLCVDGEGRRVPTPASNQGHLLWSGMANRRLAPRIVDMLFASDMFSGWGIRTLSSTVVGFNPLGYHVGSVWPHDNALILNGLRWYGFDEHARELADALLQAALAFPEHRVPELFSGDARELRLVPTPYPVASRPQAWSAASIPYLMTSMLGLRPGAPGQLSIVRPILPLGLREVRIRNLRLGAGAVDLTFRRLGSHVSVEVEHLSGPIEVVLASTWPDQGMPPRTFSRS